MSRHPSSILMEPDEAAFSLNAAMPSGLIPSPQMQNGTGSAVCVLSESGV